MAAALEARGWRLGSTILGDWDWCGRCPEKRLRAGAVLARFLRGESIHEIALKRRTHVARVEAAIRRAVEEAR